MRNLSQSAKVEPKPKRIGFVSKIKALKSSNLALKQRRFKLFDRRATTKLNPK